MNAEKLLLRNPVASDVGILCKLMGELGHPIEPELMLENLHMYAITDTHKTWVVETSGVVIACMAAVITHNYHKPGAFLRIITLVVDQSVRNHGVGKYLVQVAEDYAVEKKCMHIELTSGIHRTVAHEFYKKLNFVELNDKKKYFSRVITSHK